MGAPVLATTDTDVRRARAIARVLDTAVGIPGTPLRIGVDAILGIIPGAGDVLGALLSGYIVIAAAKRGVSPAVLWRMVANVAIDTAVGAIPVLGDLFDVVWKSNTKNVELLERYIASPEKTTTRSRTAGILVVVVVLLALIGLGALAFMVARAVWRILTA